MRNLNNGIDYTPIPDDYPRSDIQGYHGTKGWDKDLAKGGKRYDLRGFTRATINKNLITYANDTYESKYKIGFEIEKNYFHTSLDSRYQNVGKLLELFRGYETDSSCGVEAVTNILPLLPNGIWRTKVYDMMHQAETILDERWSGSDARCGGHINLSVVGWSGERLFKAIREFSGLIQSLYRLRLYRTEYHHRNIGGDFCNQNMNMICPRSEDYSISLRASYRGVERTLSSSRYNFCSQFNNRIEFRVPPRVTSVKCLMLRYQLFYELVDFAVTYEGRVTPQIRKKFYNKVRPIILDMSDGNVDKARTIISDAKYFQKFIDTKGDFRNNAIIKAFINPTRQVDKDRRKRWLNGEWR